MHHVRGTLATPKGYNVREECKKIRGIARLAEAVSKAVSIGAYVLLMQKVFQMLSGR
jgi:hypothetical protein